MCIGGKPSVPEPKIPAEPPRMADAGVQQARADDKKRQRAMAGRRSTIKTKGLLGEAPTTSGNLLGG